MSQNDPKTASLMTSQKNLQLPTKKFFSSAD